MKSKNSENNENNKIDEEHKLWKAIGKRIKLARFKVKYTQEQLAEKIHLSPRYVSNLERGMAFGSASTIVALCQNLNINADFLFNDLIANDAPILDDITNDKFLEDYVQLNDTNKKIISVFTNDLLKLQNETEKNNSGMIKIL